MRVFDLLRIQEPLLEAKNCKVHLARYNKYEKPLDVFIEGRFDEWQCWQSKRHFQRNFVLSFVQAEVITSWLFVGLYRVKSCKAHEPEGFMYELERVVSCEDMVGRLYAFSPYTDRNSYVYGETLEAELVVSQILPRRLSIKGFPGYKHVDISKAQLDIIVEAISKLISAKNACKIGIW